MLEDEDLTGSPVSNKCGGTAECEMLDVVMDDLEDSEDEHDDDGFAEEGDVDREGKMCVIPGTSNMYTLIYFRLESIELLENLALSFLSQLNDALSDSNGNDDSQTHTKAKSKSNKRKITFEIADRTYKSQSRMLQYPKRCTGPSIRPIGRAK